MIGHVAQPARYKDLFEPLLDAVPCALFYVDAAGVVQAANGLFGVFFGLDPVEAVGRPVSSLADAWSRAMAEPMSYHEVVAHPFEERSSDFVRDVEVIAPEHRYLEVASSPVRGSGAYLGRLWTIRDVTRDREITELKIRYGGLRNADEIKSKFLTVASHQLRTPMNSMRWNLELMLSDDKAISAQSRGMLHEVYQSVLAGLSIIDDMLLAVDIEQRTLRLEKASVDIAETVSKVIRDHARSASLRSVALSLTVAKGLPPLFIDGGKMEKALGRLVDNAIRYTPPGGHVDVGVFAGKDDVSVSIRDTGIGITEEDQARLFGRFYRSERSIKLNPDASGLGLYIAKYIIDAHDGKIGFRSKEGRGSTFTVSLPRRAAK